MNRLTETARTHPHGMAQFIAAFPVRTNDWSQDEISFVARVLIANGHTKAVLDLLDADGVSERVKSVIDIALRSSPTRLH